MNILIVDDELPALLAIKYMVDWPRLEVENVYTAADVPGAKRVFERQPIDFLLCDIEMPQENGLELLSWVRENHPDTIRALLTNHAEFSYAQQAMALGSIDYLLKPIVPEQLERLVRRAGDLCRERRQEKELAHMGESWETNRKKLLEGFWLDLIYGEIPSNRESIERAARRRKLCLPARVLPVLISVRQQNEEFFPEEDRLAEYALCNSAEEMILETRGVVLHLHHAKLLALRYMEGKDGTGDMETLCEGYVQLAKKYFSCDVACCLGQPAEWEELAEMVARLEQLEEENVSRSVCVLDRTGRKVELEIRHLEQWRALLMEEKGEIVIGQVAEYLSQYAGKNIDAAQLYRFQQAFLQMLYHVLEMKNIQAHLLLGDKKTMELFRRSQHSIEELERWVRHVVERSAQYAAEVAGTEPVVERIKKYVSLHIDQDISREDIANAVFLNKDYMARVFKHETGVSVAAYVQREKLKLASALIASTDIPISDIASQIGYFSFSHFSRMFRQYTGMAPMEYRKAKRSGGEGGEAAPRS